VISKSVTKRRRRKIQRKQVELWRHISWEGLIRLSSNLELAMTYSKGIYTEKNSCTSVQGESTYRCVKMAFLYFYKMHTCLLRPRFFGPHDTLQCVLICIIVHHEILIQRVYLLECTVISSIIIIRIRGFTATIKTGRLLASRTSWSIIIWATTIHLWNWVHIWHHLHHLAHQWAKHHHHPLFMLFLLSSMIYLFLSSISIHFLYAPPSYYLCLLLT